MAEEENQQGNIFYKEGKYVLALKCFNEANKKCTDTTEAKYLSNATAVLFEMRQYVGTIKVLCHAWRRLSAQHAVDSKVGSRPPPCDPLAVKLATRFGKAKVNGHCCRTISLHSSQLASPTTVPEAVSAKEAKMMGATERDIETFVMLERPGDEETVKVKEMHAVWAQWRGIRRRCAAHGAAECRADIAAATTRLRALPIFKSASDPTSEYFTFPVQSLVDGVNGSCTDGYILDAPHYAQKKRWSFLFGGSGDARHVFGTLIHLAQMQLVFDKLEGVHLTLVDVHPASLARVIIVLSLLRQILHARLNQNEQRHIELYCALFYVYHSIMMPNYCCQIVIETAKSLVEELPGGVHGLSKCLHINDHSLPVILKVLRYWSQPLQKSTKAFLQKIAEESEEESEDMELPIKPREVKANKQPCAEIITAYDVTEAEMMIFKRTKILLPPKSLVGRHPALARLTKVYKSVPENLYKAALLEVEQTWVPNPTLFGEIPTEVRDFGYPNADANPFETFIAFLKVGETFGRGNSPSFARGMSSFSINARFFEMVADAVWELQDTLKVEVVVSEVITGVPRLLAGELGHRPDPSPSVYHRMWLSNVPDYTHGLLNTAVHLAPHLPPGGLVMSRSLDKYRAVVLQDMPRILGCHIMYPQSSTWGDIVLKRITFPRPVHELASKKELHDWLAPLLLSILCNGVSQPTPMRIDLPSNLGAFFHVLVHLYRVGFPPHWIGDFVQSLVSDNLFTDAALYLRRLPMPVSFMNQKTSSRRVHLRAWQAELQVILASTRDALPFPVDMPLGFPTFKDIRTYCATVRPVILENHPDFGRFSCLSSPSTKTVGLIFYKPHRNFDAEELAHRVPSILEGASDVKQVNLQIMLSPEYVNLGERTGEVSWKMSWPWYEMMKAERWKMALYKTDLTIAVTEPLAVDEWREASA